MSPVIEKQAMQQEVTIDAGAMARDIGESGRVAIYGIYFDTGRAELKPESAPAMAEIAKMLKQSPVLRVYVVGHTDMTADLATNVKLSLARAQSVVNALVSQHGIAAARLIPYGDGPYAPVATNRTEEGRAKNRRVELVEIAVKKAGDEARRPDDRKGHPDGIPGIYLRHVDEEGHDDEGGVADQEPRPALGGRHDALDAVRPPVADDLRRVAGVLDAAIENARVQLEYATIKDSLPVAPAAAIGRRRGLRAFAHPSDSQSTFTTAPF